MIQQEPTRVASIYNPHTQSKSQLMEGFVVRHNTFNALYKAIREAKMETPEQHYLILGRRGMGKTTLLLRLAYEIENDAALNTWLLPLVFNEEEYGIRRLFKFWERVMDLLEQRCPEIRFDPAELKRLSQQYDDDDQYERALFDWLSAELERAKKKVILFIDNFGDIANKLNDQEAHRLRKILQTNPNIRIIAASSIVIDAIYKYDHPFYEFFKVVELKGLDSKEARDLLLRLSEHYKKETVARIVEENPGRVEALRRITGGVTRTMVLLFEIFADDDDGNAFKDLEVVLDRTTPLYKHRMDDLSHQQQAIVEAIAHHWDALSVKDIAEQTRLDSKTISAQLQLLEKNGIIDKKATRTKNHLYLISERFFNIWYLMRNGRRSDERRVLWLVRFFEDWCDGDMMKARAAAHRSALQGSDFDPEAAYFYTLALSQTAQLNAQDRHELLRDTRSYLMETSPEYGNRLGTSELDEAYEALELWFDGRKEEALEKLEPLCGRLFDKEKQDEIEKGVKEQGRLVFWEKEMPNVALKIGGDFYLLDTPEYDKAEQCWLEAAKQEHVRAMFNLGVLFQINKIDLKNAMIWYEKAAGFGHSNAMFNIGTIWQNAMENRNKAMEWYEKAAAFGHSKAMYNIGTLWQTELDNLNNALEWYEKAANLGNIKAMNVLAWIAFQQKKDKLETVNWCEKIMKSSEARIDSLHTAACVFAWDNQLEKSKELAQSFLRDKDLLERVAEDIATYFILMLAKGQAQWLYDYFTGTEGESAQLKDRFKPIWYAILKKLDHPDFLRMGDELTQTVDEILAKAQQFEKDYA
ncbi:MAG: SEL1-like repeat protein [Saprospiraceae bacterium]|nr:SEL1-like repeat protein [Saprospiraceae bacterium]